MRNNILTLKKYLKQIKTFKELRDLDDFLLSQALKLPNLEANILKGAMWENFSDHLCERESSLTGISNIVPATPDEDYFKGTDGFGTTTYTRPDMEKGEDAILQCKWKNPYLKDENGRPEMLTFDTISRSVKLIMDGKIKYGRVCIMTNLPLSKITQEVKDSFKWIVCKDHMETTLKNNQIFWRTFAEKIDKDFRTYNRKAKDIIKQEKDDIKKYPMLDFQNEQIDHAIKNQHTFNKLPPRSGKTKIQGGLIEKWLKA